MTCTESQYSQIKKEALAATWACEKFATYMQGNTITLEMDHKPVVPLLSHQHWHHPFREQMAAFFYRI